MKTKLIEPTQGFKPIVLQITIESKEELDDFVSSIRSMPAAMASFMYDALGVFIA